MKVTTHLAPGTRAWFTSVVATYSLEPHHLRLLQLAGEAWDRCQQAREAIARDGLIMLTTGKAHPAVAIERDSRLAFARLIRELDLDAEPPPSWSRPPGLHSNSAHAAHPGRLAMPRKLRAAKQRGTTRPRLSVGR